MKKMEQLRLDSNGETRVLYHLDYWDGPISGVCLYNGKKCYFNTVQEVHEERLMGDEEWIRYCVESVKCGIDVDPDDRTDYDWYRIFGIYDTPDDVIEILEENHALFRKYVGTHCDYYYDDNKRRGEVNPNGEHHKFYGANKRVANMEPKKWKIFEKFVEPF